MTFLSSLRRLTYSATLLATLLALVSCGSQKPMVDSIKVVPTVVDDDIIVSMTADLGIGNVQLPIAGFPIILPKTGKEIGLISLLTSADGKNQLHLEINVSEAANLEVAQVKLPNGSVVPLIGQNKTLEIPVGSKVKVYLSITETSAALGVAIPIKTFDAIGKKTGTAALMPVFNKNGVLGAAGIYTSKTPGKNGFALVADLSSKIAPLMASQMGIQMQQQEQSLDVTSLVPSARQEKRINRELLKLHKKRKRLQLD